MGNSSFISSNQVGQWLPLASFLQEQSVIAGVIVEPREHPNLVNVVKTMHKLYPTIPIYLFHGITNASYVNTHPELQNLPLICVRMEVDNLTPAMYNALFTTRLFWDIINAQYAFVFQTDVTLCESPSVSLNSFIASGIDYIGSPSGVPGIYRFLNGGVSLRNVEAMKRVIDACPRKSKRGALNVGEDIFFSRPCKKAKIKVASVKNATNFGWEMRYSYNENVTPVAIHKPWAPFYGFKQFDELENICPGVIDTIINNGLHDKLKKNKISF